MPAERVSMRQVQDVLRLRHTLGMSYRSISDAMGVGRRKPVRLSGGPARSA